jgi:hypothetical protein
MGGRQIFETSQEVHIREEDNNKSNREIMAKLLVQMSFLLLYIRRGPSGNTRDIQNI